MFFLLACTDAGVPLDSKPAPEDSGDTATDNGETGETTDTTDSTDPTDTGFAPAPLTLGVHAEVSTILTADWTEPGDADTVLLRFQFEDQSFDTPERPATKGAHHEVLLGIPSDTEVSVQRVARRGDQESVSEAQVATTGSLPAELPIPTVVSYDETRADPSRWLLGSVDEGPGSYDGPMWTFLLDRQGRVVWYRLTPDRCLSMYVQAAADGTHLLIDRSTLYAFDGDLVPSATRTTLDGAWVEEVALPDFVLAIDELPDGTLVYEGREGDDSVLAARSPDGARSVLWNATDWHVAQGFSADGWSTMPNTIVYEPSLDTVLWSMFTSDTVLEVELGTGTVVGQYGQLPGGWTFDPSTSVVDYQHYANYTPDGRIIVSTHVVGAPRTQRTREFEVDRGGETLREVWTFGEGVDHYADYAGEAHRTPNGNRLIGYGTGGAVLEVTEAGDIAWELLWTDGVPTLLMGHVSFVDDLYALNAGPS